MRGWIANTLALGVVLLVVLMGGCAGSTATGPPSSARPTTAASGAAAASDRASAAAHPSVDPAVLAAATAYKAAADAYNRTVAKLAVGWQSAIVSQPQTTKVRAHYKAMADAEQTFADAIGKVAFPKAMAGHIANLLAATDKSAALDLKASRVALGAQVDSRDIFIAERVASAAAELVRADFKVLGVSL